MLVGMLSSQNKAKSINRIGNIDCDYILQRALVYLAHAQLTQKI